MALEEGDIVLCTVERIDGTNVFVNIENEGEGIIMTSEIAPGRIRNIRDYVVPKKKIVCKILRIVGNRIELSLRRVTLKEQKEVMEHYKVERSYISLLKTILGEKSEEAIRKIQSRERLYDFFEEARKNQKKLEEFMDKPQAGKIFDIISVQKQKKFELKREITLSTIKSNGLELIKNILMNIKDVEVKYISAGHYSLSAESEDLKNADTVLKNVLSEVEKGAKKSAMDFSILEK